MFVNTVSHTVVEWVQHPDFDAIDTHALYDILCALTRRFGVDATVKTVPLVFKLQSMVQQGVIKGHGRQVALASVTVAWFTMIGQYYHVDELTEYTERIEQERARSSQWCEVAIKPNHRNFVEHENSTAITPFMDRHDIVEFLTKPLRDESDTHGLELESKLYAEWGSEAFSK